MRITGTQINYYYVCKRKLWLFSRKITMERESELVSMGRTIHEHSYIRKRKEISLEGIKIDFFEKNRGVIHEVKRSKAIEDAHIWQLKYYIYRLKKMGIEVSGKIDYPEIRRSEDVLLADKDGDHLEKIVNEIKNIIGQNKIPPLRENISICKKCSYYEICFI
jgi:CRISPR-associated exonuclease Cas4